MVECVVWDHDVARSNRVAPIVSELVNVIRKEDNNMFRVVLAMSASRQKIIGYLDGASKEVALHVAKCAMYQDTLGRYNHWIHELAIWISDGNDMTCKPGSKKLRVRDYEDTIFGFLGDGVSDAKTNLHELQRYNRKFDTESYPYVEVTGDMINRMYRASRAVVTTFAPLMASRNDLELEQIEDKLHEALDPECLK